MSPQFGEFERMMANEPGSAVSMPCTIGWHGNACLVSGSLAHSLIPCSCSCHKATS